MYNEGWLKTGAHPEQVLANLRSSEDTKWTIQNYGKESLAAAMKSQAFVPAILTKAHHQIS